MEDGGDLKGKEEEDGKPEGHVKPWNIDKRENSHKKWDREEVSYPCEEIFKGLSLSWDLLFFYGRDAAIPIGHA